MKGKLKIEKLKIENGSRRRRDALPIFNFSGRGQLMNPWMRYRAGAAMRFQFSIFNFQFSISAAEGNP